MIYDARNRGNLDGLADNTKIAAYKWYQYCIDNKIQILIYETIRSKDTQAEYVKNGKSKTMNSYHIVGQALDFVFVDDNGKALWSINDYVKKMDVIKYAKLLGFTWGGDWDNDGDWRDETFIDSPHLQFNYKGYGKDTFNNKGKAPIIVEDEGEDIMQFTNVTTKAAVRDKIKQATDKKLIDVSWLVKFDDNKMTYGDYLGLDIIINQRASK